MQKNTEIEEYKNNIRSMKLELHEMQVVNDEKNKQLELNKNILKNSCEDNQRNYQIIKEKDAVIVRQARELKDIYCSKKYKLALYVASPYVFLRTFVKGFF